MFVDAVLRLQGPNGLREAFELALLSSGLSVWVWLFAVPVATALACLLPEPVGERAKL
jgi:hypothetical protein